ncbi:MAG: hypothetical protein HQM16_07740 [Deltaproteobacteria bacterium]|nr:hypothetical protein [Deltaproteobacteria bacterium]
MTSGKNIMDDCALLISSCDGYADLWTPFFNLLHKNWPDCPFPVFLITEEKRPVIDHVTPLALGKNLDWSSLLLKALDAVGSTCVLFMLEDFFLREPIDTQRILHLLGQMKNDALNMLRVTPNRGPNRGIDGKEFGEISREAPYRVSTQAAFWRVTVLKNLLVAGESAWQFEMYGSTRSRDLANFVAVWQDALTYRHHVVERGKWFPWEYNRFKKMNIGVDIKARPPMSLGETLIWITRKKLSPLYQWIKKYRKGRDRLL